MNEQPIQVNDVGRLRAILFETLDDLKSNRIDADKAKAISETAQVIINSAKVEIDAARITGKNIATNFLSESQLNPPKKTITDQTEKPAGYVHKMGGVAKEPFHQKGKF